MLANLSLIAFQSASLDEASAAMACNTSKTYKENIYTRTFDIVESHRYFSTTTSTSLIMSATSALSFHKRMFVVPEIFLTYVIPSRSSHWVDKNQTIVQEKTF